MLQDERLQGLMVRE